MQTLQRTFFKMEAIYYVNCIGKAYIVKILIIFKLIYCFTVIPTRILACSSSLLPFLSSLPFLAYFLFFLFIKISKLILNFIWNTKDKHSWDKTWGDGSWEFIVQWSWRHHGAGVIRDTGSTGQSWESSSTAHVLYLLHKDALKVVCKERSFKEMVQLFEFPREKN